ncbi:hypothetical protein [uncultured Campylobacter sp.]|nr:hypothetical protein [uncultured Campylobacter sp.]
MKKILIIAGSCSNGGAGLTSSPSKLRKARRYAKNDGDLPRQSLKLS